MSSLKSFFRIAFVFISVVATISVQGSDRLFVPALADVVSGANQSLWRVEMRVFNGSMAAQDLRFVEYYPWIGSSCEMRDPVTLAPGEAIVIREFGCSPGSVTAAELEVGDNTTVEIVLTNISGPQDPCCHTGYSTHVPVILKDRAYGTNLALPNLPLPWRPNTSEYQPEHLIRHNMLVVNPQDLPATINYRLEGTDLSRDIQGVLQVPARSSAQINDVFYPEAQQIGGPSTQLRPGYYNLSIDSDLPVFVMDSQVNNINNDATLYSAVAITETP